MNSRAFRLAYWVMTWTPLGVLILSPESWSFWRQAAVSIAIMGALFASVIFAAIVSLIVTGRDPDFGDTSGGKFSSTAQKLAVPDPPSNVRRIG